MNSLFCDVAIVGAGPAGSTAAKLLQHAGTTVALIDKAKFPRHKTCASWVNRLAFDDFPYLRPRMDELVDLPFYGIRFFNHDLSKHQAAQERSPSGYLTLRDKFDHGLKNIAVEAGAEFFEESAIRSLRELDDHVEIVTSQDQQISARVLIGADGAQSRVAELSRIRKGWNPNQICMCANEDISYDSHAITEFYGRRFPINVMLRFEEIEGYGWVFPKKNHICIGIGARLQEGEDIRSLYSGFLARLKQVRWIPSDLESTNVHYAIDPAGVVNRAPSLVKGRVILIGDAAGFVSGATGEGIYPAMRSAKTATAIILEGLRRGDLVERIQCFDQAWKNEFGSYIKDLPGGERRSDTLRRLDWIFKNKMVCHIAAKVFLYGKNPDLKTLWESLWS